MQLISQGEKVDLLALFDTYNPIYFHKLSFSDWFNFRWQRFIPLKLREKNIYLSMLANNLFCKLRKITRIFSDVNSEEDLLILLASRGTDVSAIELNILTTQLATVNNYHPQKYPGKLILFRSSQQPWWIIGDRNLAWGEVAEEIEVRDIPGDHDNIVRESVIFLAKNLKDYLNCL